MKVPPLYMVLLMYMILCSHSFMQPSSLELQNLVKNNIVVRHFFGIVTMLFLIVLTTDNHYEATRTVVYTIALYTVFLMSTRISIPFLIPFLFMLASVYIIHLYAEKERNEERKKELVMAEDVLTFLALLLVLIGFLFHLIVKRIEYNTVSNTFTFVLGKPSRGSPKNKVIDIKPSLTRSKSQ